MLHASDLKVGQAFLAKKFSYGRVRTYVDQGTYVLVVDVQFLPSFGLYQASFLTTAGIHHLKIHPDRDIDFLERITGEHIDGNEETPTQRA